MGGVTVTGHGAARGAPDRLMVTLGAESRSQDVQQAMTTAVAALSAARQELLDAGVAEHDLRTAQTTIWPDHGTDGGTSFTARLTLHAVLRDLAGSGPLVQAALTAAGPSARLDSMSFAVADPTPLAEQARQAAFRDATARAEQYATLAGRRLGAVRSVTEQEQDHPRLARVAAFAASDSALPVDPGEQTVDARVTVRWSWAD